MGPAGGGGVAIDELSVCGADRDELCKVGMLGPGGGFVFFIDYFDQFPTFCASDDCNYLEVAPDYASTSAAWCNSSTLLGIDAWENQAIGAGRTNTAVMLGTCTAGAANLAATYEVTGGAGAGSWWLPSLGELMVMYRNLRAAGVGDFLAQNHWSSSEGNAGNALWKNFSAGGIQDRAKTDSHHVRPIRAF